jgi:hypothetical protein
MDHRAEKVKDILEISAAEREVLGKKFFFFLSW